MDKVIYHLDLDAFYAAVIIRENPELEDVPLIVGPDPRHGKARGVVLTSSYPARPFGIRSGMSIAKAYALCPEAVFIRPPMTQIVLASKSVMTTARTRSTIFEQCGLDEAYFIAGEPPASWEGVALCAKKVQDDIRDTCRLSCSIGASTTRALAKIASDIHKPGGLMTIPPLLRVKILTPLELRQISGVGKKTYAYISEKGYKTFQDVYSKSLSQVEYDLGRTGRFIWQVAHGLSSTMVGGGGVRKSIGKERTFMADEGNPKILEEKLTNLGNSLQDEILRKGIRYATITLKVRFASFKTYIKAFTFPTAMSDPTMGLQKAVHLFRGFLPLPEKVRLIGLRYSNLSWEKSTQQFNLTQWLRE